MNIHKGIKGDPLKQYFNPELIEKAPDDFTSKVMMRIQTEAELEKVNIKISTKSKIPVIAILITIILVSASFILSSGSSWPISFPGLHLFQNINSTFFKIDFNSLFKLNIPGWLPYLFLCILILTILDRGLFLFFHREK